MVFRHQRIPTGENNLIQFWVLADIIQRLTPVGLVALVVLIREMAAEAVTAVDRTAAFNQQQSTITVFMQQARHHTTLFIQRVGCEARRIDELFAGESVPGAVRGHRDRRNACVRRRRVVRAARTGAGLRGPAAALDAYSVIKAAVIHRDR